MILRLLGWVSPPQKKTKNKTKIVLKTKVRGCCRTMHVSIHAHSEVCEISAVSGVLHVLVTLRCFVLHFLFEKRMAENQGW